MSSTEHTNFIIRWLDQVAADRNVPSSAFRVGYVIAHHVNEDAGEACPSAETIAKECGLNATVARTTINSLVDNGYISMKSGRFQGGGRPNRYRLILKPRLQPDQPVERMVRVSCMGGIKLIPRSEAVRLGLIAA